MPGHHDPTSALPSPRRILDIASGYEPALILEAAVRIGVFDLLHSEPLGLAEVAVKSGASQRGLRALLDGLVAIELLERDGERYALTPESAAYLVTSSPRYQGYMCKHVSRHLLPRWMKLTDVVRSGQPTRVVNEEADGGAYFREFVEDIFPMSYDAATVLADELGLADITQPHSLIDLAAGSGVWGVAMAQASQLLQVTAVDWAEVLPVTRRIAQEHGVLDQFRFIEGNILDVDFGNGHQFAMLGHIIHSEGEARSRTLLKKTFDALAPGGTVIIAEFVADEDRTGPAHALIFAVTMLVNTQEGGVYTFNEMAEWLSDAGFEDVRMMDVPGPAPLILATKSVESR